MILEDGKFEGKNMTQKELDELGPFVEGTFDLLMTGDLSNQQRLMINQIKDSLSDK